MTNNHNERAHALLGGSSAERWTNCPASAMYAQNLPPASTSDDAKEGTSAHEYAEKILAAFLNYRQTGNSTAVELSGNSSIEAAADGYRDAIWKNILQESITGKVYGIEDKMVLDAKFQLFGTIDFWAAYIDDRGKSAGAICDFKYGYHFVDVSNNAQLAFYAVALRESFRRTGKDIEYVTAAIYQPRTSEGEPYRSTKFSAKQLDSWHKKFLKAAEYIYTSNKPKYKLGSWCKFCPAQGVCPTYAKHLEKVTNVQLLDVPNTALPNPEYLPIEVLINITLNDDVIDKFLKNCKSFLMHKLLVGERIPGVKLVEGATRRKWPADEQTVGNKLIQLGVNQPYRNELKTIGQIEKELTSLIGSNQAKAVVDKLATRTKPSLTLVHESDPRPAVGSMTDLLTEE